METDDGEDNTSSVEENEHQQDQESSLDEIEVEEKDADTQGDSDIDEVEVEDNEKKEKEEEQKEEEEDDDEEGDSEEEVREKVQRITACQFPALICFLCHDSVEKCLKGLMYAKCGLKSVLVDESCLTNLSTEIDASPHVHKEVKEIVKECVSQVSEHRNKSRYPHYQIPPCTPASVYTSSEALGALRATRKLLIRVKKDDELSEILGDLDDLPEKIFRISVLDSDGSKFMHSFFAIILSKLIKYLYSWYNKIANAYYLHLYSDSQSLKFPP